VGVALLDSSAVVAFLDADDTLHPAADRAVRDVAREHALAVSAVTFAEVLTGAKLGHHDETVVRRFLTEVVGARLPVDDEVAERAAELRAAERALRMPDALILATADLHADAVLTGDARWPAVGGLGCVVTALGG
jgi:predicted nucleic acid-binding protein